MFKVSSGLGVLEVGLDFVDSMFGADNVVEEDEEEVDGAGKGVIIDGFTVARNWSMFCMFSLLRLMDSSVFKWLGTGGVEEGFGGSISIRVRTERKNAFVLSSIVV